MSTNGFGRPTWVDGSGTLGWQRVADEKLAVSDRLPHGGYVDHHVGMKGGDIAFAAWPRCIRHRLDALKICGHANENTDISTRKSRMWGRGT
jgi:hypothetical protein